MKTFLLKHKKIILITIIAIAVVVIVSLLVSLYFFLTNKSNQAGSNTPVSKDGIVNISEEDIQKISTVIHSRKIKNDTGIELIDKDFKDGKIDQETAFVNKAKYVFADEGLSKNYLDASYSFEPGSVFYDIKKNYNKLSEETKQALDPYLKRPSDPDSYLSKNYTGEAEKSETSFKLIDTAHASDRPSAYNKFLTTADNKIKVWYPEITAKLKDGEKKIPLYEKQAKQIIKDLDTSKAYTLFNLLLGYPPPSDVKLGGDDKVDIYLVSSGHEELKIKGGFKAYGVNIPDMTSKNNSSYILVNVGLSDNLLKATVAHELFHVFQYIFPFDYTESGDLWWLEATAVWAEDYAYPNLNTEHEYVSSFVPLPEQKLNKVGGEHEYGSYVFPFYLTQIYGDEIIAKIFKGLDVSDGALSSIGKFVKGGFEKNWKEFTLWNYNKSPVEYYAQKDGSGKFPGTSSADSIEWTYIKNSQPMSVSIKKIQSLSAQVIEVHNNLTDKKIKKIEFNNLHNFNDQSYSGVKAIVYPSAGSAYVEDWSNLKTRAFCLEKSKENITSVVLIFNNALTDGTVGEVNFNITPKESCEEEKKKDFYIQQADQATKTNVDNVLGNHVWNVTLKSDGKMIGAGQNNEHPYIGKWKVDYEYKEASQGLCMTLIEGAITSFKFDLAEAYDEALKTGRGSFVARPSKDCTSYTNPTTEFCCDGICTNPSGWCETVKSHNVYGELYDLTADGAKIFMKGSFVYDSETYAQRVRSESTILYIKKK